MGTRKPKQLLTMVNNLNIYIKKKQDQGKKNRAVSSRLPLWLLLIFTFALINSCFAQLKPVRKVYYYKTKSTAGVPIVYKLFYIIRKGTKKINNKLFNEFTFSKDSNTVTGYLRFDPSANGLKFILQNFEHPFDHCDNGNREQDLFSFFNDSTEICTIGCLGGLFSITSQIIKNSDTVKMTIDPAIPPASDGSYIIGLLFIKNFYPESITISDVVLRRDIILQAQDIR